MKGGGRMEGQHLESYVPQACMERGHKVSDGVELTLFSNGRDGR